MVKEGQVNYSSKDEALNEAEGTTMDCDPQDKPDNMTEDKLLKVIKYVINFYLY